MAYREQEFFDRIEYSELSPRLQHILMSNGIAHLSTLQAMSDGEILVLRNIGPDYLREIRTRLGRPGK